MSKNGRVGYKVPGTALTDNVVRCFTPSAEAAAGPCVRLEPATFRCLSCHAAEGLSS